MEHLGYIQLALYIVILLALTKPMGLYLVQVLDINGRTFLHPVIGPLERLLYRILGIDSNTEQDWKQYTLSLLAFSLVGVLFTYCILRSQHILPLNPEGLQAVSDQLSFNTAVSFTTNTNWQNYGGESTMSYFSQMVGLVFHNFVSAAVGIAVAAALVRGIARHSAKTIGNFWVDLVRINLYLLLPVCLVYAVFLVSQGMIQNFKSYDTAQLIEPYTVTAKSSEGGESPDNSVPEQRKIETQRITQGPMASQVAIKMLGTNGGGFTNANASHPFENPTPLSNFLQMLSIFLIPSGLTYYLGRIVKNQRHGWAVWAAMAIIFLAGVSVCWWAESAGNPRLHALGVDISSGNMEGKEVRFGIFNSALFATITTAASCGAVNSMHDSFTPLGGLIPLLNIELGEVVFGGVGAGLYGMLVFVVLAVFLAGLMIGRTPEYLGKKIESYDIKAAVLFVMAAVFGILGFTALASVSNWGLAGLNNAGPHGFSEMLYAFSSGTGNNGSAFAGLNGNTVPYNITLGLAMLVGRFFMIVPVLALAGHLAQKKIVPQSSGSFPVTGPIFVMLLVGTVLIVGALTFFPALSLGPIVEHFLMTNSSVLF
ncbi:potassium-transporting ATPase subunit KdpA [Desulfomonile tiedjei]|uniref:Potassium-transporting ATPase potassium-binding subunit n=1 Tax=Desulfomonile tiedjei (strain ATCC 49306 / DSM 6799 / DCB-1) TaxID=706587 RepID=I4C4T4_DESTA|nr:potassium-transporting ATPase subunit KdpA [Desulfomonile tiedjei]AFM24575.1 K+-transporting ATPase, KdpA [Desulfomonile tiedjei DSM 6799]